MERKDNKKKVKEQVGKIFNPSAEDEMKNVAALKSHRKGFKDTYKDLMERTTVEESERHNKSLFQKLVDFGVDPKDIHTLVVKIVDGDGLDKKDDIAMRGGFTMKEARDQVCNKTLTYELISEINKKIMNGRDSFRKKYVEGKSEMVALIYEDAKGAVTCVHLANALTPEEVASRESVAAKVKESYNNKWLKSCQFSGHPNQKLIQQKLLK